MAVLEINGKNRLLLVNVRNSLARGVDLYDATRAAWRLDVQQAEAIDFVLAVSENVVIGVFVPHRWKPATPEDFPIAAKNPEGRWAFDGRPAPSESTGLYLGRKLPEELAFREPKDDPVRFVFPPGTVGTR